MDERQNIAEVIVDLPIKTDNLSYQYLIPKKLKPYITIGSTIIVPFTNRRLIGYVIKVNVVGRRPRLKEIIDVLDEPPVISPKMMQLFYWMSDYYLSPLSECIKLALPPGRVRRLKEKYSIIPKDDYSQDDKQHRKIAGLLKAGSDWDKNRLMKLMTSKEINDLISRGYLRKSYALVEPRIKKKQIKMVSLASDYRESSAKINGKKQKMILNYLTARQGRLIDAGSVLKNCHAASATLKSLHSKGLVSFTYRDEQRYRVDLPINRQEDIKKLTPFQDRAIVEIKKAIKAHRHLVYLLEGVTGSGKTEVYIEAIKEAIKNNLSAIVLVPEIALTPQLTDRFRYHFNDEVAVLHSGLSLGERYDQWQNIYHGEASIVIGPRSALFAPLKNPGLIIIDEEHETSYKQNRSPRYHVRETAVKLAAIHEAVLVAGSATPSLETKLKVKDGEVKYLSLPKRVLNRKMPAVEIVDMRAEHERDNYTIFSDKLRESMQVCVNKRQKMIIFLNRRGYSSFLLCKDCGYVAKCKNCSISLTYHYEGRRLQCHHCGYSRPAAPYCPKCGSLKLKYSGTGTEKVESELKKLFPNIPLIRMDADTTTTKGAHRRHLTAFAAQSPAILLGTQMVAKGLDFPEVSLIGVINADLSLNLPDFRAAERTFQLLMQVSGRSGRGEYPGRVIIQTYLPNHYVIQAVAAGDADKFYTQELAFRAGTDYPPFSKMINIVISGPNEEKVEARAKIISSFLHQNINDDKTVIYGPGPAPIAKLKQNRRWHLFLTTKNPVMIKSLISANWAPVFSGDKSHKVIVDVDPSWVL